MHLQFTLRTRTKILLFIFVHTFENIDRAHPSERFQHLAFSSIAHALPKTANRRGDMTALYHCVRMRSTCSETIAPHFQTISMEWTSFRKTLFSRFSMDPSWTCVSEVPGKLWTVILFHMALRKLAINVLKTHWLSRKPKIVSRFLLERTWPWAYQFLNAAIAHHVEFAMRQSHRWGKSAFVLCW